MSKTFNVARILRESVVVSFADYLSFGSLFLVNVLVNRYYGTVRLGEFSLVYAIAQISVMSLGAGFSAILRRDVALDASQSSTYVATVLRIRAIVVVLCLLTAAVVYSSSHHDAALVYFLVLMVASKGLDLGCETYYTAYQAVHAIRQFAILKALHFSTLGVAAGLCCTQHWEVHWLYELHVCVSTAYFALNTLVYWRTRPSPSPRGRRRGDLVRYLVRETWPLIVNAGLFQLSSRSSIIIVNAVSGREQQGLYASGLNIIMAATAVANSTGIVLFPYLSRLYAEAPTKMASKLRQTLLTLLVIGLLMSAALYVSTPTLLRVYGKLPANAGEVFRILSMSTASLFVLGALGYVFTIVGRQRLGMYLSAVVLVVNVVLFYALATYAGAVGAAAAFVILQAAAVLLYYVAIFRSSAFAVAPGGLVPHSEANT